ncbi:uncharacterized protein BXZ73DRAFT_4938, partial [Epithele typhae]|uniref:uncharacterized protein n=1 Tax=Epithele typhae TaxID=378194 RepID=UPI00200763C0
CEQDNGDVVQRVLQRVSRPSVLMRDFALGVDGGMIYPTFTLVDTGAAPLLGPDAILEEDTRIGQCWRTTVPCQVGISTPVLIYPSNITIDHIPREIAADIRRAPRHMILWGVVDGDMNKHRLHTLSPSLTSPRILSGHSLIALVEFEYDIHDSAPIQTFPVFDYIALSGMDFGIFLLDITDNWGASDTCIYRVRIH